MSRHATMLVPTQRARRSRVAILCPALHGLAVTAPTPGELPSVDAIVTHVPSGMAVARCASVEGARNVRVELLDTGIDWTADDPRAHATSAQIRRAAKIVRGGVSL